MLVLQVNMITGSAYATHAVTLARLVNRQISTVSLARALSSFTRVSASAHVL